MLCAVVPGDGAAAAAAAELLNDNCIVDRA